MGQLIYGAWRRRIDVDDRTLTHLRIALRTRMQEGVSFQLTWRHAAADRTSSILIHPGTALEFRFDEHEEFAVNRRWLRAILRPSQNQEMVITAEPPPAATAGNPTS